MGFFRFVEQINLLQRFPKEVRGKSYTEEEYRKIIASFGDMSAVEVVRAHFISEWMNEIVFGNVAGAIRRAKETIRQLKQEYNRISESDMEHYSSKLNAIDTEEFFENNGTDNSLGSEEWANPKFVASARNYALKIYTAIEPILKKEAKNELFGNVTEGFENPSTINYLVRRLTESEDKMYSFDVHEAAGFPAAILRRMLRHGFKEIAKKAKENPEVRGVHLESWIVRSKPWLFQKVGFTVRSNPGDADMSRVELLERYGK